MFKKFSILKFSLFFLLFSLSLILSGYIKATTTSNAEVITWQKTFGGRDEDWANSIQQTSDGGYIVAGYTYSFGQGKRDVYILKLDENGNTGPYPSSKK